MSDLPIGWIEVPLMEFIKYLPTGVPTYSGEKEYYSTGSIQESQNESEGKFTFDNRPSRANRISKIGDVFQARMKGTDKGLLIEEKLNDKLFSTGFIQLRPYENTYESKLLYYFVKSKTFIDQKDELATGSTQEALTDTNANELILIVPPFHEQKRIVEKLDKLLTQVDEAKRRLEKIPIILKRFRQSVLNAAVTGELTKDWRERNFVKTNSEELISEYIKLRKVCYDDEVKKLKIDGKTIPKLPDFRVIDNNYNDIGWIVLNVESAAIFIIDCLHSTPKFVPEGKYCIDTNCIEPFKINWDIARRVDELTFLERTNRLLPMKGDILFSREGTIGTAVLYKGESQICLGQRMMMFRFSPFILPEFSELLLLSNYIRNQYLPLIGGTSAQHLNIGEIRKLNFVMPNKEEQKEIVNRVETLFKKADEIEERYKKAKTYVDKITQSILAKAFRGELVPQDPNDESAEKLLERVKAEKEKFERTKNIKVIIKKHNKALKKLS